MTPYQSFLQKYSAGCGSCQCDKTSRIVFCRGNVPCSALFVGEAPGASEDVRGIPFDGPAGALLDSIVKNSMDGVTCAFTNLVGCLPRDKDGSKAGEPELDQIKSCRPRLKDFIALCKPKLLVMVGALSEKHTPMVFAGTSTVLCAGGAVTGHPTLKRWRSIVHPAFILRAVPAHKPLLIQRSIVTLANAVKGL